MTTRRRRAAAHAAYEKYDRPERQQPGRAQLRKWRQHPTVTPIRTSPVRYDSLRNPEEPSATLLDPADAGER
jgi:hypothetical protein